MFGAARYFAPRYFAPRYWPKVGSDAVVTAAPTIFLRLAALPLGFTLRTKTISMKVSALMAKREDFSTFQGEAHTIRFAYKPATDITSGTFKFEVAATEGGVAIAALTKTPTVTSYTLGTMTVTLSEDDTDDLAVGERWFSLRRTDSGNEEVLNYGIWTLVLTPVALS